LRIRLGFLALVLAFPVFAFSQSTLNFPRAFSPADLASTGFAVVNPGGTAASVTFTLYSATGAMIGSSAQTIPAAGQFARVGTELFPAASQAGWVQMTSAAGGLQGFWVGGDFATFTDGADSAAVSNDLIFPLVTSSTEINIANTAANGNNITIRLFGADGTELAAAASRSIAANAVFQSQVSVLFSGTDLDNARYIRVTGSAGLTGTAVISNFLVSETGVTNAVPASAAANEANFPHVISGAGGGGNYTTILGVTNLSNSTQTVTITFTPEDGSAPSTVTRSIAGNGSLRDTAENVFSFPPAFQNGWVRVSGSSVIAFVAYADSVAGGFAVVPAQNTPRTSLMFAHIADLPPWFTGIALLNTTGSAATVSVYAMNPDGSLIAGADSTPTARFQLGPGAKTAKLLLELLPQTQSRPGDSGFIFINSTQPLFGLELFFSRTLRVFANVAAGNGAGFTPPGPTAPLELTLITPARAAVGAPVTLTGSGFSSTASNNTVVFAGADGLIPLAANSATATTLSVTVPNAAIAGPVFVQRGGQSSSPVILEVVATATSLLPGAPVAVVAATTTANADIYVPPAAGNLNIERVGIGDAGQSFSVVGSSAEVALGQTKVLGILGTGFSQAAGSTVTISGTGITVGTPTFQAGSMLVTITVAASAEAGPRNIIVTNSNLDRSVFSGGLLIR
jgi:hypothetical protein